MSSLRNLRDRLVYACDDYPLYGSVFRLNLLCPQDYTACSLFTLCLQVGTAAKSKNLLELNRKYKGVSWRYSTAELWDCVTFHDCADVCCPSPTASGEITCWKASQHFQVSLCSWMNHFSATTSSFYFSMVFSTALIGCTCSSINCSMSLYSSDILKKFNPSLKGFSKDKFPKQNGFNMAVAGAKASYVPFVFQSFSGWVKAVYFWPRLPVFAPLQWDLTTGQRPHQGNEGKQGKSFHTNKNIESSISFPSCLFLCHGHLLFRT